MRKLLFSMLGMLWGLTISQKGFGQSTKEGEYWVEFPQVVLSNIRVHPGLPGTAHLVTYHFESPVVGSFQFSDVCHRPKRHIAVLGVDEACICIGDTISLRLLRMDSLSGEHRDVTRIDLEDSKYDRLGRISKSGYFRWNLLRPVSIDRPAHIVACAVRYRRRLHILMVQGTTRTIDWHRGGDSCTSCKKRMDI